MLEGGDGHFVPSGPAGEDAVKASFCPKRVAYGEYFVVFSYGDSFGGGPDGIGDSAGFIEYDEEIPLVESLELVGFIGGEADGVPLLSGFETGGEEVAGQLRIPGLGFRVLDWGGTTPSPSYVGGVGVVEAVSDLFPEDETDLPPSGGCGEDDGRLLGVEEPESEIGREVGFADSVGAFDGDSAVCYQAAGDVFLAGPPGGAEDIAGESGRVLFVFLHGEAEGIRGEAGDDAVQEGAQEGGFCDFGFRGVEHVFSDSFDRFLETSI
jgi:hypothetical protein